MCVGERLVFGSELFLPSFSGDSVRGAVAGASRTSKAAEKGRLRTHVPTSGERSFQTQDGGSKSLWKVDMGYLGVLGDESPSFIPCCAPCFKLLMGSVGHYQGRGTWGGQHVVQEQR